MDIEGVESCYGATFGYRAIFPDSTVVNCDKEVLLVKNQITGDEALSLKYYIPYPGCGTECEWSSVLSNDGDAEDYSGVILYTTLEGYPVRFDRYMGGEYTLGIFLPYLDTEEKRAAGYEALVEMQGGVTLQRVVDCQTKGGDYSQSVNEVKVNDPLQESICIAEHGLSELEQQSLLWDAWVYWAWMNRPLNPIGTVPGEGLGGSAPSTQDDDKDKDKEDDEDEESLEELEERILGLIDFQSGGEKTKEALLNTIKFLINTERETGTRIFTDVLRNSKTLEKIIVCSGKPTDHNESTSKEITIRDFLVDQVFEIAEEFFHVFQFQSRKEDEDSGWKDGNYELEAKIYGLLIWNEVKDSHPELEGCLHLEESQYSCLFIFYQYPIKTFYNLAKAEVRQMGDIYSSMEFNDKIPFPDMKKHLKGITWRENQ